MESPPTRAPAVTAPLLAMSATAHNGLEKLSIRLAELQKDGIDFSDSNSDSLITHLEAARVAAGICLELVRKMRREPIEVPAPLEDHEAGGPTPTGNRTPEDEMFPAGDVTDVLTGLPGRSLGARAIQSAISVGRPRFVAVFCVDRLRYMSTRYSTEAGQQAIRNYNQYLRQKMPGDTMLFRWGGGSLIGLFDLSGPIGDARALTEAICAQKVKFNFESEIRSALLNLTSASLVVGLTPTSNPDSVVTALDNFVETHSRKQTE